MSCSVRAANEGLPGAGIRWECLITSGRGQLGGGEWDAGIAPTPDMQAFDNKTDHPAHALIAGQAAALAGRWNPIAPGNGHLL